MKTSWSGVFPAVVTQLNKDQSINLEATARHLEALIDSGVKGLVMLGSLGENTLLEPEEKRRVMQMAKQTARGRVQVLSGVAENSTALACQYARDMEKLGIDGLMVLPGMVYKSDPRETVAHFRAVARSSGLPVLCYNNPIAYGVDLTPRMFAELADEKTLVAIKESSGDPRRVTDLINLLGDRYAIFCGVDDLIYETVSLGATGWVTGLGLAFPKENQRFWDLMVAGRWEEARAIYRWYTPLLHLDAHVKFVHYVKLAVQECGFGAEWLRAPRLPLAGAERENILAIIHEGIRTRPAL
ncbi:MAG TPA: dihydrodipicolinate synthase family protein [Tepidisphaeraceae bacterium]|jgi:4-hydroxy-tetrahydrodipicolinate synthase|nr:dihydrodipicolinate synthase family protein [Tepidisphaeraceae bacterium]